MTEADEIAGKIRESENFKSEGRYIGRGGYQLELERPSSDWRLRSAKVTHSCQAGRGHAGFSTEPCV